MLVLGIVAPIVRPAMGLLGDFSVSADTPAQDHVAQGDSATSAITVQGSTLFSGNVRLSARSSPNGPSLSISPDTVSLDPVSGESATATLTISTSSATSVGTYSITVIGNCTSVACTSSSSAPPIQLTVEAKGGSGDFSISASPASLSEVVGQTGTSTISLSSSNGFAGTVALSSDNSACSLSPLSVSGGSGSSTLSCTFSFAGSVTVTVTGTSGSLHHAATVAYTVTAAADFTISASPTAVSVAVGQASTSTITVAPVNGFTGTVALTVDNTACSLSATSVSGGSGSSTLSCTLSSAGSVTVTVTGTSGSLSHTATVMFTVTAAPEFSLSANPSSVTVAVGQPAASTITVSPVNGFIGTVALTSDNSACTLSPPSVPGGSGSSTLSCTFASPGSVMVTVTGTSSSLSHTATVTFSVTGSRDFNVSANPSTLNILVGESQSSDITLTSLNGFTGAVHLWASISSSSLSVYCNPLIVDLVAGGAGHSTCTMTPSAVGSYNVTVAASSGSLYHAASIFVRSSQRSGQPDFILSTGPKPTVIQAGISGSRNLTLTSVGGFSGNVTLTLTYPNGLSASLTIESVNLKPNQQVSIGLDVSSTEARNFSVTISADSGKLSHAIMVIVSVVDFAIGANPSSLAALAGSFASSAVTITSLNGFCCLVSLHGSSSFPGISGSFNAGPVTLDQNGIGNATLTITVADSVPGGAYTVRVDGTTSAGLLHYAVVTLTVVTDFTISADPPSMGLAIGGSEPSRVTVTGSPSFSGSILLSAAGPAGGVELVFDQQNVRLGPGRHIIVTNLAVSADSSAVPGTYTILIVGTSGAQSRNATILLVLTPDPQISAPSSLKVNAGSPVVFTVTASDADSSRWMNLYAVSSMPWGATFTTVSGTGSVRGVFNWVPSQARDLGEHNITFTVTDDHGGKASTSIIVTVNPVNRSGFSMGAAGLISLAVVAATGVVLVGNLAWKGKLRLAGAWFRSLVKSRRSERRA